MHFRKTLPTCAPSRRASLGIGLFLFSSLFSLTGCLSRSLTGIEVQPAAGTVIVAQGGTQQYHAIGLYSESGHQTSTEDITDQVTWSSTVPLVATINASTGLATGVGGGTSVITATIKGTYNILTANSDITVAGSGGTGTGGTRTLSSVTVIPGAQTVAVTGQTAQFLAIGSYSSAPTSENLTGSVTWTTSDASVAQVSSSGATAGLVTGTGVGTATITALATGPDGSVIDGTATVTVSSSQSARDLTALNVSPGSQTITTTGQTAQLIAIGTYSAAPITENLTGSATWQSSDTQVATVTSGGLVTGVGTGSATITALATNPDGSVVTAAASVSVTNTATGRVLTSISIIPLTQTVGRVGETAQFLAIGTYSAPPLTADLTNQVTWLSSDTDVGTINATGLATTIGTGTSSIAALMTLPDTSVISATGTLTWPTGTSDSGSPTTPTLTLLNLGSGGGTVSGPNNLSCVSVAGVTTSSSTCTATFTLNQTVTLIAAPDANSVFDGWASNCTPVPGSPMECTITLTNNSSVGAIFDPK